MSDPRQKEPGFGFVEWFRKGEHQRVERAVAGMVGMGAKRVRTHLSWAEYHEPDGRDWYDWLIPTLADKLDVLPCVHYTPPSLSRTGRSSGAPVRLLDYPDFIDEVLTRYGHHFTHVELWNEPNNLLDWDWRIDRDWNLFCEMIGAAAHWTGERGWKAVLAGPCPFDAAWLDLMGERGVLAKVAAVGLHGFPGTWDSEFGSWKGWRQHYAEAREILDRYNGDAEIWITEAGYSTWRNDEIVQVAEFLDLLDLPAARHYWYGWQDIAPDVAVQEGHYFDPRHYHLGVVAAGGRTKLLGRCLAEGGVAKARAIDELARPALARPANAVTIIGGAGFIGSNLAKTYLEEGRDIVILDDLSRPGVERNLDWLKREHGDHVHPIVADVRDRRALDEALCGTEAVFHFAAQVAVTTSLDDPIQDFSVNAEGTLAVLEAARRSGRKFPLVFSSTNKVYGGLDDLAMSELADRYAPADEDIRAHGVGETRSLDFCTPYGCSKGVADQYVLDYAKSYGLPTAVLRMSCIYGPRQFGTEDQGWVAHFLIKALRGEPITIFGNGKQVRDILHVADAVAAYRTVSANIGKVSGQAFNLGGGPANAVSLKLVLEEIARLTGRKVALEHGDWRQGDQFYFVADTRKLAAALGWRAEIGWRDGMRDLTEWLRSGEGPVPTAKTVSEEAAPVLRAIA
ncbi:NAD-dependent epimerase/dehydratase family protein [Consotaella salsifontis]|uniref:CDP-paratose 2-epimerase n=1 Tax=Consotaella salsifontis TaxID=1365950 RepID=A0A1T4PQK7_9HYPH|nr:NAD-dependent epimerase/dehydratase family protein [Consotaella salsifontis]SJZ93576.1 CDP-paratose 2-epimerase [Consotaella salsifontis]